MTLSQQLLQSWNSFKSKLTQTIHRLKQERFVVLTTPEINILRKQLEDKKAALSEYTKYNIGDRIGYSRQDEAQMKKLMEEVEDLKRKLKFQADITQVGHKDKISIQTDLTAEKLKSSEYL